MRYHKDDEPRETVYQIEKNYSIEKPLDIICKPLPDEKSIDPKSSLGKKFKIAKELLDECKKPVKIKKKSNRKP